MLIDSKLDPWDVSRASGAGFTILELMVSTLVFTVIMLVVAVGAISFTNSYYKGIASSKTQAAARGIMSTIVESIQFSQSVVLVANGTTLGVCVDNTLYSYLVGQEVIDNAPNLGLHQDYHGLIETVGNSCTAASPTVPGTPAPLPAGSRELLGQHMRVSALSVTQTGSDLYTVRVRVVYGEDDLLSTWPVMPPLGSANWSQELCRGGAGSQFCAVSDLTTTVQRRLL